MTEGTAIKTVETGTTVTPAELLQIAVQNGADVDKLEKLLDLQMRWEADQARKAFVVALGEFKADPPQIVKNRHVAFGQTEYDHATLDQVCNAIGGALAKHGLNYRWEVEQEGGAIKVTCALTHVGGHTERVSIQSMPDDSGGKNSIQSIGSAIHYLQRYTLLASTGLATTSDQDDDGAGTRELISGEQKETLVALMRSTNADGKKFFAFLGIETLDELPAAQFELAKVALERKQEKVAEKPDTETPK